MNRVCGPRDSNRRRSGRGVTSVRGDHGGASEVRRIAFITPATRRLPSNFCVASFRGPMSRMAAPMWMGLTGQRVRLSIHQTGLCRSICNDYGVGCRRSRLRLHRGA
jgi:hypothetical protein